jgi:hypothetical protein
MRQQALMNLLQMSNAELGIAAPGEPWEEPGNMAPKNPPLDVIGCNWRCSSLRRQQPACNLLDWARNAPVRLVTLMSPKKSLFHTL